MDAVRTFGGQFDLKLFHRDINKAYNGFSDAPYKGTIATGNWGCGGKCCVCVCFLLACACEFARLPVPSLPYNFIFFLLLLLT